MQIDRYIPGRPTALPTLLSRYLAPIPANVARAYIAAYSQPGDIILDPFAHSPAVIREAAANGRHIIAATANPIVFLATQGSIALPAPAELDALTTRLADSPKVGHTLRHHLEDLYRTHCPHCSRAVIADAFIWEHDPARPVEKVYRCPTCGDQQHAAVDKADHDRLAAIEARGFHYHYVLERLAGPYEEHRPQAQRLLDLYTARNLYALANLTLRVETTFSHPAERQALSLILLGCLDACSKLNASPWDSAHPPRLRPPRRFVELNVWRAFETMRLQLRQKASGTPLTIAGSLEEVVGAAREHTARALALVLPRAALSVLAELPPASLRLALAALPPLDPVFYNLCFLWAGWLYGRQAAAKLEPLLQRRSHDWAWYEKALARTLAASRPALQADSRMVLIGVSHDPSYLEAVLTAASRVALSAPSIVHQPVSKPAPSNLFQGLGGEYRITLEAGPSPREAQAFDPQILADSVQRETLATAEEVLRARAEPLTFDRLHSAIWQRLSQTGLLSHITAISEGDLQPLEFTRQQVRLALEGGLGADLAGLSSEARPDGGAPQLSHWWLSAPDAEAEPLSDRVERTILEMLTGEVWVTEEMVYGTFPGLLTPDRALVTACLRAYGTERSPGVWQLRQEETEEARDQVSHESIGYLVKLGRRLNYRVLVAERWDGTAWPAASTLSPRAGVHIPGWLDVLWLDAEHPTHAFTVRQDALLAFLLSDASFRGADLRRYVVLPGQKAEIARLKVASSPLLRQAMAQQNWSFIKFHHLRRLAHAETIGRHHLRVVVGLDPIIEQPEAQIPLF